MGKSFILLVEDNPDDAFLASRVIAKVCGEEIVIAKDGEEAIALLRRMAQDGSFLELRVVLLDLKLPKIHGLEVLQEIRNNPVLARLPVVVLTSSDNELDQQRCRELGVIDYIYKPMSADRLRAALSRHEGA